MKRNANQPTILLAGPALRAVLYTVCLLGVVFRMGGVLHAGNTTQGNSKQDNATQEPPVDLSEIEVATIDRDPFDRLHFDSRNGNAVLDVNPLEIEGVDPAQPIDPRQMVGRLVFSSPDYPGRVFDVAWTNIDKVERYSELVLQESRTSMDQGDFATAFKTLIFLAENTGSESIELRQLMDRCLYGDGKAHFDKGDYSDALAAFEELYKRNPRFTGGDALPLEYVRRCCNEFVKQQVEAGEFQRARALLSEIQADYGDSLQDIVDRWTKVMTDRAMEQLGQVQEMLKSDDAFKAHESVRRLMYVNPDLPEAAPTFNEVVSRFPHIYVGVSQPSQVRDIRRIDSWAARRVGWLTKRWLMEYQGPGDEGGNYRFPSGLFTRTDDVGLAYRFVIQDSPGLAVPEITSFEISNRLLDLADPDSPDYYVPWARIADTIEIVDEKTVAIRLKYPHVRPEALLPLPYFSATDQRSEKSNGLYAQVSSEDGQTVYQFNPDHKRPEQRQLPLLVEKLYSNTSEATEALIRGELDVVDRIFPPDYRRLKQHPAIDVKAYVVPTTHLLIPNPRNEFMQSDDFLRAILYGINRPLIVNELITGGEEVDGFQVLSGPFAPGTEVADQFAYAYDFDIRPREFSAHLAIVLAQKHIIQEERRREAAGEQGFKVEMPTLVLAHPDTDLIGSICSTISQQLGAVGIPIQLRKLEPGVTRPPDDDYDLLFVELQMSEPMVDAYRLFGDGGLVKTVDPTIKQALRQLDSSYSWAEVSRALRRMHRQSANNLSVIPLWQIVEHCAYRKNVFNIGDQMVHLYENLDRWQIAGQPPQVSQK